MPHRIVQRRTGRVRRRTLVGRVLGLSPDAHIDSLKNYLHEATLTDAPTEKLDLVMLESYEHFAELLADGGIPLAREDMSDDLHGRAPRVVKLEIRLEPALLIASAVSGMCMYGIVTAVSSLA